VSYTIEWFIPNGSEPLEKQAEMASAGQWLSASPETISLQKSVAQEIQSLDPTLKVPPSERGSGCWIRSDDQDCPVPYVELDHGTATVQGGLGPDEELNDTLLRVHSIFERHGFGGCDPSARPGFSWDRRSSRSYRGPHFPGRVWPAQNNNCASMLSGDHSGPDRRERASVSITERQAAIWCL
jgi:hypothetical protein